MHARLRGSKSLLPINQIIIKTWFPFLKPQLHCHDFGHDGATTHPDLSSRDASAWVVVAP